MSRLIETDSQGNWALSGVAWKSLYAGQIITDGMWEKLYGALWKLMEYENTGFSPDQISDMCDLYDEKCEELEKANMHWIPVSDQIPDVEDLHDISIDHCTGYLVRTRSGGMMIAHYIRVFGDAYFECRTLPIRDVVAWMPLPEPYRRNGGKRL